MLVKQKNTQHIGARRTFLTIDHASSETILNVYNTNNFIGSWAVQIGETDNESAELQLITGTPAAGLINLSGTAGLLFNQPKNTPVYTYEYDKMVFMVSTSGTEGTATVISGGTVSITPNRFDASGESYTVYNHTAGSPSYAYKTKLYNSLTGSVSAESDWITPSGYSFYSLYQLRSRAKAKTLKLNLPNETIDQWLNEWHESMVNALIETNRDYAMGSVEIAFTAGQRYGTITAPGFKIPRLVNFVNSGTVQMTSQDLNTVSPYNDNLVFNPKYYFKGDTIIGRTNVNESGTMQIDFYKVGTCLTTDTDILPPPMQGYTRYYVDYVRDQASLMDKGEITSAEINNFELKWESWVTKFKGEVAPRQRTNAETINIRSPLDLEF